MRQTSEPPRPIGCAGFLTVILVCAAIAGVMAVATWINSLIDSGFINGGSL